MNTAVDSRTTIHPIVPLGGEFDIGQITGHIGRLETIPISSLYVDSGYQRAISTGSVRNIKRICASFDWAKFLPVIVTQDGEQYSIVDGQHRTTAAATIGIDAVPCYVLSCTPSEAAAAFAAINGNVTPVRAIDLWFAELAAGAPDCVALQRVLETASVKITRKKEGFLVGETGSISILRRALDFYGSATLTTILQCIVETGNGNPGMIFGAVVNGVGRSIRTKPDLLAEPSKLFEIFDDIELAEVFYDAKIEYAKSGNPAQFIITRVLNEIIRTHAKGVRHAA